MENWYIHIIHFHRRGEDEVFLGPCTREVVLEWLPRNRFEITEDIPTEIRGSRWITKEKIGLVAIFHPFTVKDLEGRIVKKLPRWF